MSETSQTSAEALASIETGSIREQVLARIAVASDGMTDDEIEVTLGLRHQTASARRRELEKTGAIVNSGRTRPTRSGREAVVWVTAAQRTGFQAAQAALGFVPPPPQPPVAPAPPSAPEARQRPLAVIVDGKNLIYRAALGSGLDFAGRLRVLASAYPGAVLIVAWDLPRVPTFRHLAYPDYKGRRVLDVDKGVLDEIDEVVQSADDAGFALVAVEGFEADDVMGSYAAQLGPLGYDVVIVTTDKDLSQLVALDWVKVRDERRGVLIGPEEVRAIWGVEPVQIPDYLALVGDKGDNLPGVHKVGPKRASELLATYRDLNAIIDAANDNRIAGSTQSEILAAASRPLSVASVRELARVVTTVAVPGIGPEGFDMTAAVFGWRWNKESSRWESPGDLAVVEATSGGWNLVHTVTRTFVGLKTFRDVTHAFREGFFLAHPEYERDGKSLRNADRTGDMTRRETIRGVMVCDPEARFTSTGIRVATLRVRVEATTTRVIAWEKLADQTAAMTAGDTIQVSGNWKTRSWDVDGEARSVTELVAAVIVAVPRCPCTAGPCGASPLCTGGVCSQEVHNAELVGPSVALSPGDGEIGYFDSPAGGVERDGELVGFADAPPEDVAGYARTSTPAPTPTSPSDLDRQLLQSCALCQDPSACNANNQCAILGCSLDDPEPTAPPPPRPSAEVPAEALTQPPRKTMPRWTCAACPSPYTCGGQNRCRRGHGPTLFDEDRPTARCPEHPEESVSSHAGCAACHIRTFPTGPTPSPIGSALTLGAIAREALTGKPQALYWVIDLTADLQDARVIPETGYEAGPLLDFVDRLGKALPSLPAPGLMPCYLLLHCVWAQDGGSSVDKPRWVLVELPGAPVVNVAYLGDAPPPIGRWAIDDRPFSRSDAEPEPTGPKSWVDDIPRTDWDWFARGIPF